jgi:opacity protein-like surface antigen
MRPYHKPAWTCAIIATFILFFLPLSFAQTENIKGVQFNDGSTIYGRVIEMNANDIRIETKDGKIISRKFDDVANFIKDTDVDAEVVDKRSEPKSTNANAEGKSSDTGFYVAIVGGVSMPMDMKTTITAGSPMNGWLSGDVSLKTGWIAGTKLGYLTPATNRILAVELEYNHIVNDSDTGKTYTFEGVSFHLDSNIKIDALMLNLMGRYPEGRFHPYIGAGAGYANVAIDDVRGSSGAYTANNSSGSKGVFAYQFLVGIDFDIASNWFVGLGYKYFAASKASYDVTITSPLFPGVSVPGSVDAEYKSNIITFSVGYLF